MGTRILYKSSIITNSQRQKTLQMDNIFQTSTLKWILSIRMFYTLPSMMHLSLLPQSLLSCLANPFQTCSKYSVSMTPQAHLCNCIIISILTKHGPDKHSNLFSTHLLLTPWSWWKHKTSAQHCHPITWNTILCSNSNHPCKLHCLLSFLAVFYCFSLGRVALGTWQPS